MPEQLNLYAISNVRGAEQIFFTGEVHSSWRIMEQLRTPQELESEEHISTPTPICSYRYPPALTYTHIQPPTPICSLLYPPTSICTHLCSHRLTYNHLQSHTPNHNHLTHLHTPVPIYTHLHTLTPTYTHLHPPTPTFTHPHLPSATYTSSQFFIWLMVST